jgi:hypothetical protein
MVKEYRTKDLTRRGGMPYWKKLAWLAVAIVGSFALGMIAIAHGEPLNAVWLVAAAACLYVLG